MSDRGEEVRWCKPHGHVAGNCPHCLADLRAALAKLLAAAKQVMVVVDEAYKNTGYIRVAETSHEREYIMSAIEEAERLGETP